LPTTLNAVQPGSFLTLHYRLAGPDGADLVNTFDDKPATLSLGTGELAPAMEARLIGLPEGARVTFELGPTEAFGQRNPLLVQRVARRLLERHGGADATYAVGEVVRFFTPDSDDSYAGVVHAQGADWIEFDFNHPLAGQPVTFEIELIGVL